MTRHSLFNRRQAIFLAAGAIAACSKGGGAGSKARRILNATYSATEQLYAQYNPVFERYWRAKSATALRVEMSHGGSGSQALAVMSGLQADVVTLALAADIDVLVERAHLLPANWQSRLPDDSAPYTSTIVFLVRGGNPKAIHDWSDLAQPGVSVITPNPKTSGGARWNYLAAWGWALHRPGGSEATAEDFVRRLYRNVPVMDTSASRATDTFVIQGIGDVLLAWENEAHVALEQLGSKKLEIVVPSTSILCEPCVAVVDKVAVAHGTVDIAHAYLEYLYGREAQEIIARNFYRPRDAAVEARYRGRFPQLKLLTIAEFGGWKAAQRKHFADGGLFDQITGAVSLPAHRPR